MNKIDYKDVFIRAVKTFIQAAVPILIAALSAVDLSEGKEAVKAVFVSAGLSAAAAGISAVWNIIAGLGKPDETEKLDDDGMYIFSDADYVYKENVIQEDECDE